MRGAARAPHRVIDWQTFLDFGEARPRHNKCIDTKIPTGIFDVSGFPTGGPQALAQLNLLRHLTFKIPSGQQVAAAMKLPAPTESELANFNPFKLQNRAPLSFYGLREVDVMADGKRPGPVGGRIVGEIMLELLQGERTCYLNHTAD